ncbi:unnamed protein product, partial [Mesorhabditis belari]|uniref:Beta-1,4-glucuronyltransferase 1 n=1 Tax=Mesorhabditis belari TaxID=2138241 RepID=A0AAF3E7Y6_9BILA
MQRWKRRTKIALISIYLLMGLLICVEYQKKDALSSIPITENVREAAFQIPIMKYKQFCIRPNVLSNTITDFDRIALILHTSADYLDEKLADQVENWKAPVSLSIYLERPEIEFSCLRAFLKELATNRPAIIEHLRVHFVYAQDKDGDCGISDFHPKENEVNCVKKNEKKSVEATASYPVNVIRNIARMFSETKYIVIADYEHMFSDKFEADVRKVAEKALEINPKQLLVYRIFEVNETSTRVPKNRNELTDMLAKKEAIVFHAAYYGHAHAIDGLEKWLQENSTFGISQIVMKYDRFNWEPQFVSLATIPLHDEHFPYQIRDNTCLRWELCRAGYQFSLLSSHFMYHHGIKVFASDKQVFAKAVQKENGKRFWTALKLFNQRMDRLYPETKKQCPTPNA